MPVQLLPHEVAPWTNHCPPSSHTNGPPLSPLHALVCCPLKVPRTQTMSSDIMFEPIDDEQVDCEWISVDASWRIVWGFGTAGERWSASQCAAVPPKCLTCCGDR